MKTEDTQENPQEDDPGQAKTFQKFFRIIVKKV